MKLDLCARYRVLLIFDSSKLDWFGYSSKSDRFGYLSESDRLGDYIYVFESVGSAGLLSKEVNLLSLGIEEEENKLFKWPGKNVVEGMRGVLLKEGRARIGESDVYKRRLTRSTELRRNRFTGKMMAKSG